MFCHHSKAPARRPIETNCHMRICMYIHTWGLVCLIIMGRGSTSSYFRSLLRSCEFTAVPGDLRSYPFLVIAALSSKIRKKRTEASDRKHKPVCTTAALERNVPTSQSPLMCPDLACLVLDFLAAAPRIQARATKQQISRDSRLSCRDVGYMWYVTFLPTTLPD